MRRRIFIAVNLPESIKKELSSFQEKWPELPARWTKKENLHITLTFLGYLNDEELVEVCQIAKEAAEKHRSFYIRLNKIIYGPPKQSPRMIWAEGEKSKELGSLQKYLESALQENPEKLSKEEERGSSPHITLARLRQWEFRRIESEEKPKINEDINLNFEVKSIEVMESRLKRGGPEYIILESCPLKS